MESGDLPDKGVLSLLTELSQNRATGSLKLEHAPLQKAVYFRDGQILFAASNDPKDQLASILVEEGKLGPEQMQIAQARVSAGNPLAKVLTELGYISQRELADAARLKVEKILTDLFSWKEGTYQFAEKSLPKGAIDLELSTPRLMFNSIQRMQDREWVLKELGSLDTVVSPSESLDTFIAQTQPAEQARDVLRLVDGVKTVKQIAAVSVLSEFEVCKVLAAATLLGAVGKGPTEPSAGPAPPAQQDILSLSADDMLPGGAPSTPVETTTGEQTTLDTGATTLEGLEQPTPPPGQGATAPPPFEPMQSPPPAPPFSTPAASTLLIDEPESEIASQVPVERVPPRPRKMGRSAGGGAMKKLLIATVGVILLAGGGVAGYYFIWPLIGGDQASSRSTPKRSAPVTQQSSPAAGIEKASPASPSPKVAGQTPPVAVGEPSETDEEPTTGPMPPSKGPTQEPISPPPDKGQGPVRPPSAGTASASIPQGRPPARPPQVRATPPPGQKKASPAPARRPTPTPSGARAASGPSIERGQELFKAGRFSEAAAFHLQQLRSNASNKFTIAVGVYCDTNNVARAYKNSGNSERLIILPYKLKGRSCYRIFWGLFDTQASAQHGVASLPPAIRSPESVPVPVSRLIH